MVTGGLSRDERGVATGVIAFGVAGLIFISSVAALLVVSRTSTTTPAVSDPQTAAALTVKAGSLSNLLLESPGYAAGGEYWTPDNDIGVSSPNADGLRRLGLLDGTSSSALSFAKLQNLRRAPFGADGTDGYVNYEEAAENLGLAASNLDFHARAYPTLPDVATLLKTGTRDPNLRITYIGDIDVSQSQGQAPPSDPTDGLVVNTPVCTISPLTTAGNPQDYRLSVDVTNGGSTTTQFTVLFEYQLGTAAAGSQTANSFLVAPAQVATIYVDVPAVSGRACSVGAEIEASVNDPGTASVVAAVTLATAVTGATVAPVELSLDTNLPSFLNADGATSGCSDPVEMSYDGPAKNMYVYLVVKDSAGATVFSESQKVPASANQREFNAGCLVAGEYIGTLYYCGADEDCTGGATYEQVVENVLVTTTAVASYNPLSQPAPQGPDVYTGTAHSMAEVGFLDTLATKFCPYYFDSQVDAGMSGAEAWATRCQAFKDGQTQYGDVLPDSKKIMNNDLPDRLIGPDGLPRYDLVNVLIAGSNIDQNAMTSQAAKGAVGDWVLGGGVLIVFGSTNQNVNWLEPIFHAAIKSSSGGISVPDPGHPVLHTSDQLDYPLYDHRDQVWNFNGQTAQEAATLFTNVVVQGSDPVTTESNPGAMGDGTVILTTWTPYDVYDGAKDPATTSLEGLKLVNNLLMQGYKDLFLDYGPPLPSFTNVVPAMRTVQVYHPAFENPIQLSVIIYVFEKI